jgi:hypothetical protein
MTNNDAAERAERIDRFLNTRNHLIGFKTKEDLETEDILKEEVDYITDSDKNPKPDGNDVSHFQLGQQDPQNSRNLLISSSSEKEVVKNALNIAYKELHCQTAAIFLISPKDGLLKRVGIQGKDRYGKAVDDSWFEDESYEIGESFTGQAAKPPVSSRYGKTKISLDFSKESLINRDKYFEKFGKLKGAIAVPLNGRLKTYGVFRVVTDTAFSYEDILSISLLGGAIADAITNFHADTESRITKFLSSALINSSSNDFDYNKFYRTLSLAIGSNSIFKAAILHTRSDALAAMEERHRFPEKNGNDDVVLYENLLNRVYNSRKSQIVKETSMSSMDEFVNTTWINEHKIKSFASFPLILPYARKEVIGVLSLFSGQENEFDSSTIIFLKHLALTIAELVERERNKLTLENCSSKEIDENFNIDQSMLEDISQQRFEDISPVLLSARFKILSDRIDDLGKYEDGWDGAEGKAPSKKAVNESKRFAELLTSESIQLPQISLATDGEINFFWHLPGILLDLGFFGDGTYSYYGKCDNGKEFLEDDRAYDKILPKEIIDLLK